MLCPNGKSRHERACPAPSLRKSSTKIILVDHMYIGYAYLKKMSLKFKLGALSLHFCVFAVFILPIVAREITFPPITGAQQYFGIDDNNRDVDIGFARFEGLSTFANLPYVHCLAGNDNDVDRYDIAILGAPFDTVGVSIDSIQSAVLLPTFTMDNRTGTNRQTDPFGRE